MNINTDQDKRKNFVSTFSQEPVQFDHFSTTLHGVLDGESTSTVPLKQAAKKAESLVLGRIDFCDDIGFYSFQTYLLDVFEKRQPIIMHIRQMAVTTTTKNIRTLKHLWLKCKETTTNLPEAINTCYSIQEDIVKTLSNPAVQQQMRSRDQEDNGKFSFITSLPSEVANLSDANLFSGNDDVWGSDDFTHQIFTTEEDAVKTENKRRKEFLSIIEKKYTFTTEGVMVPKNVFRSPKERAKDL